MFEKLAQMMQDLQNCQKVFDPAQFGDPIATQTGWGPARGGGSSLRTYKLVKVNPYRVEFKTTTGAIIFSLIFALPGLGLLILLIPNVDWSSIDMGIMIGLFLGLTFASLGGYMFYRQMLPIVFDKHEGFFWKDRKPEAGMLTQEATAKYARLELVHALQIVAEYISSKNGGYYSYELNLVLKNGNRINLVDHGKRNKLAEDAGVLAEFLGVPVWDATISRLPTNAFSVTGNQ
jgi:hypothetical protein